MTKDARKPRILLAEDERNIAAVVSYNLEKRGYDVEIAERGDRALERGSVEKFDLIILDVMMPGMNGFDACEALRERRILTPILMLTARSETENRIKGLRMGADDYLGKPFEIEELLGRVEALLRRRQWDAGRSNDDIVRLHHVEFDSNLLELRAGTRKIALTAIEARLLRLLYDEKERVVSRAIILKEVWGLHEDTQTRTLDTFIMRLRQHLDAAGGKPAWIESIRGVGYRLTLREL